MSEDPERKRTSLLPKMNENIYLSTRINDEVMFWEKLDLFASVMATYGLNINSEHLLEFCYEKYFGFLRDIQT